MKPALWYDPVALLKPKGKRNREHKRYLRSKAILRLLDQLASGRNERNHCNRKGLEMGTRNMGLKKRSQCLRQLRRLLPSGLGAGEIGLVSHEAPSCSGADLRIGFVWHEGPSRSGADLGIGFVWHDEPCRFGVDLRIGFVSHAERRAPPASPDGRRRCVVRTRQTPGDSLPGAGLRLSLEGGILGRVASFVLKGQATKR